MFCSPYGPRYLGVVRAVDKAEARVREEEEEHLGPILDPKTVRAAARPIWPKKNMNQISLTWVKGKGISKGKEGGKYKSKGKFKFGSKDGSKGKDGKGKSKTFQTSDDQGTSSSKPTSRTAREPQHPSTDDWSWSDDAYWMWDTWYGNMKVGILP